MKSFKFKAALLMVLTVVTVTASAKTIVVLDTDEIPVIAASVTDGNGVNIALTDPQGCASVNENAFPLTVKALGLKTTSVASPTDTVIMPWDPMAMDEVVVSSQGRPIARVVCYIRSSSGMITDGDTTRMIWEGMVDYLIPVAKTKMKGRDRPRLLNRRYAITSTAESVDSTDIETLTFYQLINYPNKEITESKNLRAKEAGTDTVKITKKGMVEELHSKTPAGYRIYYDFLADKKNHSWSPWFLKMLGFTIDIKELAFTSLFGPGRDETHNPLDLKAMTVGFHMIGRGKWIRKAFGTTGNVDINNQIEVFPVDITFLTEQEAKETDNEPSRIEFILPALQQ